MINFSQVLVRGLRELFPWGLQYSDVSRSLWTFGVVGSRSRTTKREWVLRDAYRV